MPPALARLRRALGHWMAGASERRPGGDGAERVHLVGLMTRTRTADDADLRLLLEARLASTTLSARDVERVAAAVIEPAAGDWVRRQPVRALEDSHGRRLTAVEDEVRRALHGLGADLLALEVVAAEHLLSSPSADRARGGSGGA